MGCFGGGPCRLRRPTLTSPNISPHKYASHNYRQELTPPMGSWIPLGFTLLALVALAEIGLVAFLIE